MIQWVPEGGIFLHRDPVDFRKSINGLCVIVDEVMSLSSHSTALFVFCNRQRDKLKVLYWDTTGFALWYKRLEKDKFPWPRNHKEDVLALTTEQWHWLLRGLNFMTIKSHSPVFFSEVT